MSPGTELAFIYQAPQTPGRFPVRPGYSGCGTVLAVANDVTDIRTGDHVAARLKHAAQQQVAADACHVLPVDCDARQLAPFHLLTIAMHGVRKSGVSIGEDVVVCGLGPIGMLAAQCARLAGARSVIAVDPLKQRRTLAQECGIDACHPEQATFAADVVIEATGLPAVIPQALQYCTRGGRLALLGSTRGVCQELDVYNLIHKPNISVIGAHLWGRAQALQHICSEDALSIELLLQRRLNMDALISSLNNPHDCGAVYRQAKEEPAMSMIPLFDWSRAAI